MTSWLVGTAVGPHGSYSFCDEKPCGPYQHSPRDSIMIIMIVKVCRDRTVYRLSSEIMRGAVKVSCCERI